MPLVRVNSFLYYVNNDLRVIDYNNRIVNYTPTQTQLHMVVQELNEI